MGNLPLEQVDANWRQPVYDDCTERAQALTYHQMVVAKFQTIAVGAWLIILAVVSAVVYMYAKHSV